jgi:uncharacterized protein YceK
MLGKYLVFLMVLVLVAGCSTTQVSKNSYNNYWTVTIEHGESASLQAITDEANRYCREFNKHAVFDVKVDSTNSKFKCE